MYLSGQRRLTERLRATLLTLYSLDPKTIAVEQPANPEFGEYALPVAFELARTLRKAPRAIASEIVNALGPVEGFAGFEIAGAGYINARLDRVYAVRQLASDAPEIIARQAQHALVEHTSINPNKAAHVGHLRNAILGDTFVRLLRATGDRVSVQNYIDNTGVQVADIVVGLEHLLGLRLAEVDTWVLNLTQPIDYACWDLYARTSQWYAAGTPDENAARKQLRLDTLHRLEEGGNETALIANRVATAIVRRHLETMQRLGIEYDLLPRESEILHLHFWDAAFAQLKGKKNGDGVVLYKELQGKNRNCWVMNRAGSVSDVDMSALGISQRDVKIIGNIDYKDAIGSEYKSDANDDLGYLSGRGFEWSEIEAGWINNDGAIQEDAKVIVRSNGTVTYVGKDIAYHLWKFGLLGKDFGYRPFYDYGDRECWITAVEGEPEHPHFGGAEAIYNVIDARQSDPQANVIEALRGLGYGSQADRYTHFSYEMVALTPRCALELGYEVAEEDRARAYIEVSGRKGFGVKADDLLDRLLEAARGEVGERNPELPGGAREQTARQIAVGALRYFMLKFTRNTVIAFDFKDALAFEGETGPYLQYAVVRVRSIFRKASLAPEAALAALDFTGELDDSIWQVWLRTAKTGLVLEQCRDTAEPAHLARHSFQLAQEFSTFYRKHHILTEPDPARKALLLATAAVTERTLVRSLAILGIETPESM